MNKPRRAEKKASDYRDSIFAAIEQITEAVNAKPAMVDGGLNWGHVGELSHIDAHLAEVARYAKL